MRGKKFIKDRCQGFILDFECYGNIYIYSLFAINEPVFCLLFYGFKNIFQGNSIDINGYLAVGCVGR